MLIIEKFNTGDSKTTTLSENGILKIYKWHGRIFNFQEDDIDYSVSILPYIAYNEQGVYDGYAITVNSNKIGVKKRFKINIVSENMAKITINKRCIYDLCVKRQYKLIYGQPAHIVRTPEEEIIFYNI